MLIDVVGWLGSALVVLAHAGNVSGRLPVASAAYHWLNIAGSTCLIVNTLYHHALPSAVVNGLWVLIAASALLRKSRPSR